MQTEQLESRVWQLLKSSQALVVETKVNQLHCRFFLHSARQSSFVFAETMLITVPEQAPWKEKIK
jgi:hypothetical protein